MSKQYKVGDFTFDTKEEYEKALIELDFISKLKAQYDFSEPEKAILILDRIEDGRLVFYTKIGEQFTHYLRKCVEEPKKPFKEAFRDGFKEFKKSVKKAITKPNKKHLAIFAVFAICIGLLIYAVVSTKPTPKEDINGNPVNEIGESDLSKPTARPDAVTNPETQTSEIDPDAPFATESYINRPCSKDEALAYLEILIPIAKGFTCNSTITDCGKRYYACQPKAFDGMFYVPVEGEAEILFTAQDYKFEPLCRHIELFTP